MAPSPCFLNSFEWCHSGKKANTKKSDAKRLQRVEIVTNCQWYHCMNRKSQKAYLKLLELIKGLDG